MFLRAANAYVPLIERNMMKKTVENGRYFKVTEPEKVIKQTNLQIDMANEYEEKGIKVKEPFR